MRKIVHFLPIVLLLSSLDALSIRPQSFSDLAITDLQFIRDTLEKNAAPYALGDQAFLSWLENGYQEARKQAKSVTSEKEYRELLLCYVRGFKDGHLYLKVARTRQQNPRQVPKKSPPQRLTLIREVGEGAVVKIPTFHPRDALEEEALRKMLQNLYRLRSKKWIIFDVRGNRGGSTIWERPILRNLFGDAYLRSLGSNFDYNAPWIKDLRISPGNVAYMKKSKILDDTSALEQDLRAGKAFHRVTFFPYKEKDNLYTNQDNEPVKACVFVLTDRRCASTCWLFVREMRQIPGVVQIGEETDVQNRFSETRSVLLPGGFFELIFPMQARIFPDAHLGEPFVPTVQLNQ